MKIRCPECCSPEVEPDRGGVPKAKHCRTCGARFPRDSALVALSEAEAASSKPAPSPVFTFDAELVALALRNPRIEAIKAVSRDSNADELNLLLYTVRAMELIKSDRDDRWIYVYPFTIAEPDPLLAVDLGAWQPTLLGGELKVPHEEGEDLVSFTVRALQQAVDEANGLAAQHAARRAVTGGKPC
jgi:hypothetical protein